MNNAKEVIEYSNTIQQQQELTEVEKETLINALKQLAMDNYNNGGDAMIECWDNKQWENFVTECKMFWRPYDTCLLELMGILEDHRKDIEATAW